MMQRPYGWSVCVPRETVNGRLWMVEQELDLLKPDHWMDWFYNPIVAKPNYTPMLWGYDVPVAAIQARMRAHPGETWMLGNEWERPEQANKTPAEAVEMTHAFLNAGWEIGAEFNWCAPNVAINMDDYPGGPWWKEYMRLLRLGGINRPSIYGIHLYNSTKRRHVEEMWERLSEWRGALGWMGAEVPIVVTEFCAVDEPLDTQIEVMDTVHAMWQRGIIQGAYWFSTHFSNVCNWPNACLTEIDPSKPNTVRLTKLGQHWVGLKR